MPSSAGRRFTAQDISPQYEHQYLPATSAASGPSFFLREAWHSLSSACGHFFEGANNSPMMDMALSAAACTFYA